MHGQILPVARKAGMEIVQERLEREFDQDLITTAPSVIYQVMKNDGEVIMVENPSKMPDVGKMAEIREPIVTVHLYMPQEYVGAVMTLANQKRGVQLNMDPIPDAMAAVKVLGADRIELYTESYATAYGTPDQDRVLRAFADTARAALDLGLQVNAGHDLNRDNLTEFLRVVPGVSEVSIGHAFIADALELGYTAATKAYLACIDQAFS